MGRPIILSNGRMMVGLDESGLVHDFYYPFVGQDNMTTARSMHHKIGVWVNGAFSWVDDGSWEVDLKYAENALVGNTTMKSNRLGVTLYLTDFVDKEKDIFCRSVVVQNNSLQHADIRIFFHQVFQISRNGRRDTALYTPSNHPYILTYQGDISFVSGLRTEEGYPFDQYAVGNYMIEGKSGTWIDAEDGELSNNTVEHGGVDSTIRASAKIAPSSHWKVDYWISASSKSYHPASHAHRTLAVSGLQPLLEATTEYWKQWLDPALAVLPRIDQRYHKPFITSLLLIKAHTDEGGGVLASGDSSIYNYGRDYYSYVWPRDAAYALLPLVRLGYQHEALNFLTFSMNVVHPRGYLHHKYQPDGAIGSTWHPMIQNGRPELNIQEDETAMLVILFRELTPICTNTDRMHILYEDLIRPALDFLASYIDDSTGLPHASYDLWERLFLTSTYTTSLVIQALRYGVQIAYERNDEENVGRWQEALKTIEANFQKLFADKEQYFSKGINLQIGGVASMDRTLDASTFYALFKYMPIPVDNASVQATFLATEKYLKNQSPIGGVKRFDSDEYMLSKWQYGGNPWFVCTLWLAQYYIRIDRKDEAYAIVNWVINLAGSSGVLSEQIDPESGAPLGVAPLVWSHAELVNTLLDLI